MIFTDWYTYFPFFLTKFEKSPVNIRTWTSFNLTGIKYVQYLWIFNIDVRLESAWLSWISLLQEKVIDYKHHYFTQYISYYVQYKHPNSCNCDTTTHFFVLIYLSSPHYLSTNIVLSTARNSSTLFTTSTLQHFILFPITESWNTFPRTIVYARVVQASNSLTAVEVATPPGALLPYLTLFISTACLGTSLSV